MIPALVIAVFWNGTNLKSTVVDVQNSLGVLVIASINLSYTATLSAVVVTTFNAFILSIPLSTVICDIMLRDNSNSTFFPILFFRSDVASLQLV